LTNDHDAYRSSRSGELFISVGAKPQDIDRVARIVSMILLIVQVEFTYDYAYGTIIVIDNGVRRVPS